VSTNPYNGRFAAGYSDGRAVSDRGVLDLDQLRTFLVVSETLSFSRAADRLGLSQSAVSQRVRRLERTAGRHLLDRDTHSVALTADGELMTGYARTILEANDDALGFFSTSAPRGRIRLGTSEDVAFSRLPNVLRTFRATHPHVDLELTVGLSATLIRRLRARELDLVVVKRVPGDATGEFAWRDQLVWLGAAGLTIDSEGPVPLVLYPEPSVTRTTALDALAAQGRTYRSVCTAGSLAGLRAAALAGLGVVPHARALAPAGLFPVPARAGLPKLGDIEFVVIGRRRTLAPHERALADVILAQGAGFRSEELAD
jgi:DNA-binding transcriptional LysR family regulator